MAVGSDPVYVVPERTRVARRFPVALLLAVLIFAQLLFLGAVPQTTASGA